MARSSDSGSQGRGAPPAAPAWPLALPTKGSPAATCNNSPTDPHYQIWSWSVHLFPGLCLPHLPSIAKWRCRAGVPQLCPLSLDSLRPHVMRNSVITTGGSKERKHAKTSTRGRPALLQHSLPLPQRGR